MSSDFAACLSEPCWDDLTAAYPLTKLIKLTHHVDVHTHAHLPASRGYPGRVTIVGGSVLIFFSPLNPPSLNLIWNDCALPGMRLHWSGLVTHDPNRKRAKTSLKHKAELIVWPKKSVYQRSPACTTLERMLKIEKWTEAHLQRGRIPLGVIAKKEATFAVLPK